jgi:hypothetical protein
MSDSQLQLTVFEDDRNEMLPDELEWLKEKAICLGNTGRVRGVTSYLVSLSASHRILFGQCDTWSLRPSLFFTLMAVGQGDSFELDGHAAYTAVTALYAYYAEVLAPRGKWGYESGEEYAFRMDTDSRELFIHFPRRLRGLLIGICGSAVREVERLLHPVINRVIIER